MKPLNGIAVGMTLLVVSMFSGSPLQAQSTFLRTTHVNFSGPVEIPGKVLPAGDYVFQINALPGNDDGRIVEIRDKNGVNLIATLLTVPDYRLNPTGDTVIMFRERAADNPQALRAWFYPGENYGHEFVYHMKRATELAAANQVNVPAVAENTSDTNLNSAQVTEETPTGGQEEVATTAPAPAPAPVESAAVTPNPPAATTQNDNSNNLVASNQPLPKTASELPEVTLAGSILIAAGLLVGFIARRRLHGERG